ncbi:MAG TPA: ATP-grasp domain-containing protein [Candidatus Nanoarchaeia archaeon]|nr:ATP-grasp domain-containing protein [Candidatus Nanoarchaeia archaeon]
MILFPAVYIGYEELFYSLKSMDLADMLIIAEQEFIESYPLEGNFIADEFDNSKMLIEKISSWQKKHKARFSRIIAIDDEDQFELSRQLAAHYNIPFYSNKTLERACNKYLMRTCFAQKKVPQPAFQLYKGDAATMHFPNMLKPLTGTGSEFILVNKNPQQLQENFEFLLTRLASIKDTRFKKLRQHAQDFDACKEFILEEFIKGDEFSFDFCLNDGKFAILRIVRKLPSRYIGWYDGYVLMNDASLKTQNISLEELKAISAKVAGALEIFSGVCMVDCIVRDGKLYVIETSIRPGLSTFIPLMYYIYNYTSLGVLAGNKMPLLPQQEGVVVHLWAHKQGKIKNIDVSMLDRAKSEMISYTLFAEKGALVHDDLTDHDGMFLGYVLLKGSQDAELQVKKIQESVKIEIE